MSDVEETDALEFISRFAERDVKDGDPRSGRSIAAYT
jgi:hypothetical protein